MKPPPPFAASESGSLHAKLTELAFACPFGPDNPPDCPLHSIRNRPIRERLQWVESLTAVARMEIVRHHCACLAGKEAAR